MTHDQVFANYHPCTKRKEGCVPILHANLNAEGYDCIHAWDAAGHPRELPSMWRNIRMRLLFSILVIFGCWPGTFGFVIEALDTQVISEGASEATVERSCPF